MSFWITKKENDGKAYLWQIDVDPLIIIMLIGIFAAMIIPQIHHNPSLLIILPLVLSVFGIVLLIISKISLYRKGIWFSFGSKLMSRGYARLYKLAYIFIIIGNLVLLMVISDTAKQWL